MRMLSKYLVQKYGEIASNVDLLIKLPNHKGGFFLPMVSVVSYFYFDVLPITPY